LDLKLLKTTNQKIYCIYYSILVLINQYLKFSFLGANICKNFVEHDYATATLLQSKYNPKSDHFFVEINNIVKFDPNY